MASFNSQQIANSVANPVVKNYPYDFYGRVRYIHFDFLVGTDGGAAAIPSGSVIVLANLPPLCKIIGGALVFSAAGTSATASVGLQNGFGTPEINGTGVAATGTEFLSAGAVATVGSLTLADTIAKNYGYLIASPQAAGVGQANQTTPLGDVLLLTTGGATYAVGTIITGHLLVVVD